LLLLALISVVPNTYPVDFTGTDIDTGTGTEIETRTGPTPEPRRPPAPQPTLTQEPDNRMWRGVSKLNPSPSGFKPRNPDDSDGLTFFRGKRYLWAWEPCRNKPFRVGFTEAELILAGLVAFSTPPPPGDISVRTVDLQLWDDWLHGLTKSPAEALAAFARGHTEVSSGAMIKKEMRLLPYDLGR
jgi:hypothetical protein